MEDMKKGGRERWEI